MNINATYMGLKLNSPIVIGSSGLSAKVENLLRCQEAGAGAVVLKSLFEEQILADKETLYAQESMYFWYPEALKYMNENSEKQGLDEYLRLLEQAKARLDIPVIASINCTTAGKWTQFAKELETRGADGIELNVYLLPSEARLRGAEIFEQYNKIIQAVKNEVRIPIALKIGQHFTNLYRAIEDFSKTGIDALVLFNRYFRPDINIEDLSIDDTPSFSHPDEHLVPMRWIALMSTQVGIDLAASTGIHDHKALVKMILAGAKTAQMTSALYLKGFETIKEALHGLKKWMKAHHHESLEDFRGAIAKEKIFTAELERIRFMKKSLAT